MPRQHWNPPRSELLKDGENAERGGGKLADAKAQIAASEDKLALGQAEIAATRRP